ncbi:unnamed protein product [Peronospora belbahrii]|uniref:AGC-kinase C-terminal domain-containing protein n=1 Tax=Peronospora belbahrii TaxID=622444 RepID=A0AAU9KXC0_9STRA|nr:unnamed protein product [Peronospora belbahrii]
MRKHKDSKNAVCNIYELKQDRDAYIRLSRHVVKRPLSPIHLLDELHKVSADDHTTLKQTLSCSNVRPMGDTIEPHDLKLLKVIGRGTYARQVALAKHLRTQSMLIQQGRVWYPPYLSGHAMSLLKVLLCINPSRRLTAAQAMKHPFFKLSLDWDDLFQRRVLPPIVPVCHGRDCVRYFDDEFTSAPVVSLKLQSADIIKRLRCGDCSGLATEADEFQGF